MVKFPSHNLNMKKVKPKLFNDKVFKEKFVSYLNKEHRCPYCNGIKENVRFLAWNVRYFCIRGCFREFVINNIVNYKTALNLDYETKKNCYCFDFKCKCSNGAKYFTTNKFKRKIKTAY